MITIRYFAAAKAAAGTASDELDFSRVQDRGKAPSGAEAPADAQRDALFAALAERHPQPPPGEPLLSVVLAQSSCLVDGLALTGDAQIQDGATVDILPPFAGG